MRSTSAITCSSAAGSQLTRTIMPGASQRRRACSRQRSASSAPVTISTSAAAQQPACSLQSAHRSRLASTRTGSAGDAATSKSGATGRVGRLRRGAGLSVGCAGPGRRARRTPPARAGSRRRPATACASRLAIAKRGHQRRRCRRQRRELERGGHDRREAPERSADQLAEIVPGDVLHDVAARLDQASVGRRELNRRSTDRGACRAGAAAARCRWSQSCRRSSPPRTTSGAAATDRAAPARGSDRRRSRPPRPSP